MASALHSRSSSEFLESLRVFDLDELERNDHTVFGLTSDFDLAYLNPAWFRFADENSGKDIRDQWRLGSNVLHATHESLRPFFAENYRRSLLDQTTWTHDYECSSSRLYRRFHMHVYPLRDQRGLLVVNTLVVEEPHDPVARPEHAPLEDVYSSDTGFITQCVHCRRVQRVDGSGQWDWVPAFVDEIPANATGSLCMPCFKMHYPQ